MSWGEPEKVTRTAAGEVWTYPSGASGLQEGHPERVAVIVDCGMRNAECGMKRFYDFVSAFCDFRLPIEAQKFRIPHSAFRIPH